MVTTYWKHPYQAFYQQAIWMQEHMGLWGVKVIDYMPQLIVLACVIDVVIFGFVIYYLTRPKVKEWCR
jgi:hypothetical protein